jgi:hypothetical protein
MVGAVKPQAPRSRSEVLELVGRSQSGSRYKKAADIANSFIDIHAQTTPGFCG